jgi:hypothetical protein
VKILVTENFRYANGQVAAHQAISVFVRDTSTFASLYEDELATIPLSNPLSADAVGNLNFYVEEGSYDFFVFGTRVPFDVDAATGAESPFVHVQSSAAATWTVTHNRGTKPPLVLELDSSPGERVYSDVTYPDLNHAVVEWPSAETGRAYIS